MYSRTFTSRYRKNSRPVYYTYAVNVVPNGSADQVCSNIWMQESLR